MTLFIVKFKKTIFFIPTSCDGRQIIDLERWGQVHSHEGVIKAKYGDQMLPSVEAVTVSWVPELSGDSLLSACSTDQFF